MFDLSSRFATGFLFLLLFCDCCAWGQGAHPAEPFAPVESQALAAATPEQSQRLQRLRDLPTTQSIYVIRLKDDAANIGNKVKIPVLSHKIFVLSKTGGETRDSKNFTWLGVMEGKEEGSATLVIRNGDITGSITSPEGLYRINSLGDGMYAIVGVNTRKLPSEEPPTRDPNRQ
jgi:hypothetical protein